jgi:hypothetical protein
VSREITVVLKDDRRPPSSGWQRLVGVIGDIIKSPLFVFVFGASLGTAYPIIKDWLTPSDLLALRKAQDQARADAALIAPFINNLDATKPGQFEASRAALTALEAAATAANGGSRPPVYAAVNGAIDAVAIQLRPPTDKTQLRAEVIRKIEAEATAAPNPPEGSAPSLESLTKGTLVYIQIERDNRGSQRYAEDLVKALRSESILAPGIEKLASATMPQRTQVRYFHDEDKLKAEQLAALIQRVTGIQALLAKPRLEAKVGTLEVWFGKGLPAASTSQPAVRSIQAKVAL